jgi:hypothetical protein
MNYPGKIKTTVDTVDNMIKQLQYIKETYGNLKIQISLDTDGLLATDSSVATDDSIFYIMELAEVAGEEDTLTLANYPY